MSDVSVLERRLQLLLDQHRYDLVRREAESSGRSVAAVIREAIDTRFESSAAAHRAAAAEHFFDLTSRAESGVGEDWADIKAALERDFEDRAAR